MNTVRDEIRFHLCEAFEAVAWPEPVRVFKGWVDNERFEAPSLTVMMGTVDRTPSRGIWGTEDIGDDQIRVTFIQARVSFPVTVVMYTPNRTLQAEMAPMVRSLFYPELEDENSEPPAPGLELVLDGHADAHARVTLDEDNAPDSTEGGLWRMNFELQADSHELVQNTYDKADYDHELE